MKHIRILLVLTLVLSLLLCGCGQDADPTRPDAESDVPGTSEAQTNGQNTPDAVETTTPAETEPAEPDYAGYYDLLDGSESRNWMHDVLGCVFADPENISLYHFFYSGMPDSSWETVSEETADWLVNQGFSKNYDLQVLPADQIEELMQSLFGISVDDVKGGIPDSWLYREEDNCYYTNHNDAAGVGQIAITWVETRSDGTIQIFYNSENGSSVSAGGESFTNEPMMLTLKVLEDGKYQIISNVVVPNK